MPDSMLKCGAGLQDTFGPEGWSAYWLHLEPFSKDMRQQGEGHVVACRGSPDGSWNQMSIYLAERKLFFPYGHVLEKLPYKLLVQSSLRLMSLYSLPGLYFQDFSGKIKPRKNTPSRPGWDDCMINVSHKARLMLLWHLWENLLVSTPTLVLVQCLIPKPNACFLDF